MISIIDYGMGNLRSVQKAFERLGVPVKIVSNPSDLSGAEKIILPGVGHFANGIKKLEDSGLGSAIKEAVLAQKTPILGICLGMQLMTNFSEEGGLKGLCLVDAQTKKFPTDIERKIPHMGWNSIMPQKNSPLLDEIQQDDLVYFVHSYFVTCNLREDRLFSTEYGISFDSAFQHEHIIGFQFHPEKSHGVGLQLLKNFAVI
jgi:imidazole glycerol-phosphate synthase subunit HisH